MKLKLMVALVALLVTTAGCLGMAGSIDDGSVAASTDDGDSKSTVSVSGTGTVSAPADLVVVSIAVEREGKTADSARTFAAQDATSMRDALRAAGIPDDDVKTTSYRLVPQYNYKEGREITGYTAVHAYEVETDNVSDAGRIIDIAVANGAARVDSVSFKLSDERIAELRSDAIAKAVDAAEADANAAASAAGVSITKVKTISVSSAGYQPPYPVYRSAPAEDSTTLEPGPIDVKVNVNIVYEVE
ncbi:SIMPL domain-containing protein [Haloarchaeobius sp. HME9146]|uniref:SIMPL domain-containing protein n=1 Tax=Haloarchaeobius sp. HME9146 TaxID=2978732 RepID=UPI0021BEBD2C|nr:SIMPL domain-containing protein [Haloarchaeobius sp. HME9146]MCT9095433.1 SIMPL domain-containing protein [Haloarchaeobius sp. HME9146]